MKTVEQTSIDTCAASDWLDALLEPSTAIAIHNHGCIRVPSTWATAERRIPEHLLFYVVANACDFVVEGRPIRVGNNGLISLPPGLRHSFRNARSDRPIRVYHCRFRVLHNGVELSHDHGAIFEHLAGEVSAHIASFHDELNAALPQRDGRMRALLYLIFSAAFRHSSHSGNDQVLSLHQRQLLTDHMATVLAARPSSSDLAQVVGLSQAYFTRRFTATYGVCPKSWIVQQRIRAAAEMLLSTNFNISETAQRFGYDDIFLFSRQFRSVMGVSPRAYRDGGRGMPRPSAR